MQTADAIKVLSALAQESRLAIFRFLIEQGIAPGRIGIAGYADNRPLVANVSRDTRARNRRVTLLVLSADDTRPQEGGAAEAGAEVGEPH